MPESGSCTVTPGKVLAPEEPIDNEKLQEGFEPVVRVDADAITEREMGAGAFSSKSTKGKSLVADRDTSTVPATPFEFKSSDYIQGLFNDGVGVVGSNTFGSDSAAFTNADTNRFLRAPGIPTGTKGTYSNPNQILLSQNFTQLFTDGVISNAGLQLDSPTAAFSVADNGSTIVGDAFQAGTTITYVSPTRVTLSLAGTNGAASFQVNGRQITGLQFLIVGRGKGWRFAVDEDGVATLEHYTGPFGGILAIGSFNVGDDGALAIGAGVNKLAIDKDGNIGLGTGTTMLGLTNDGKFFAGAAAFADAIATINNNGNCKVVDLGNSAHQISTGALDPAVADVIASPAGGAITNPTNVSLNCLTKYSRIYYRLVALDGVSTNASKTYTSATAAFTKRDEGKAIAGTNIPAGTYIEAYTNATTITLSQAATASGTSLDFQITPDRTDTLYVDGTPFALTATRRLTARAYKNGEYSALGSWLFSIDATTVPNPIASPVPGGYGGSTLAVTLSDILAGSTVWWSIGDKNGSVPADPDGTQNVIAPVGGNSPSGVTNLALGTWVIKARAIKAGLTNSAIVTFNYTVTRGSSGGGGHGPGGGGGYIQP